MQCIHATSVNIDGLGLLIRGPSGSGKSDLALRLIDAGGHLIADDQTQLNLAGQAIVLNAPTPIAGKIEIRGYGIFQMPYDKDIALGLVVDLKDRNTIERMPEMPFTEILTKKFPRVQLNAFDVSAIAKIRLIMKELSRG